MEKIYKNYFDITSHSLEILSYFVYIYILSLLIYCGFFMIIINLIVFFLFFINLLYMYVYIRSFVYLYYNII